MARPSGEKTRCSGQWTEAKFSSFIRNQLRSATRKWAPISITKKKANVERGVYECAECKQHVPPTIKQGRKRVNNVFVDHIKPIVDPEVGFTNFDDYINRMFCEEENLQLLCGECHDKKSMAERALAAETRKRKKNNEQ
jgi:5-methylcytosine-specific restriction endonuclease McrA